ncbi:MAG: hypothetical protein ILA29_04890, partial [Prevotella sp.]|nr:hypothetical protein [Prevotella sp.]
MKNGTKWKKRIKDLLFLLLSALACTIFSCPWQKKIGCVSVKKRINSFVLHSGLHYLFLPLAEEDRLRFGKKK